jgi:hypothetical protein
MTLDRVSGIFVAGDVRRGSIGVSLRARVSHNRAFSTVEMGELEPDPLTCEAGRAIGPALAVSGFLGR